jgi:Sec-independent protein translocase protein TatA
VGFGTEILLMLVLGLLLLGPKRLPAILGHVARAKAQFESAARSFKSQVEAELETQARDRKTDSSQEAAGNQ